tara:strand:+ start:91 stop:498 length:408 start_codon:yes stop_codon:yes gene_type:complete
MDSLDEYRKKKIRDTMKLFKVEEVQSRPMEDFNVLIQTETGQKLITSDNRLDPVILKTIQLCERKVNLILNKPCEWIKNYLNWSFLSNEFVKLHPEKDFRFFVIFCMDPVKYKECELDDYNRGDSYYFYTFDEKI